MSDRLSTLTVGVILDQVQEAQVHHQRHAGESIWPDTWARTNQAAGRLYLEGAAAALRCTPWCWQGEAWGLDDIASLCKRIKLEPWELRHAVSVVATCSQCTDHVLVAGFEDGIERFLQMTADSVYWGPR